MIESAVLQSVGGEISDVGEKWVARVKAAMGTNNAINGKGSKASTVGKRPSEWLIAPSFTDSPPAPPSLTSGPAHIPPQVLASYPPLAEQTNAILGVLNSLRLLAPRRIMYGLLEVLDEALGQGGHVLCEYLEGPLSTEDDTRKGGGEKERKLAKVVGEMYFRVFVPFLRRALVEGVYGVRDIADGGEVDGSGSDSKNGRWKGRERLKVAVEVWEEMCR